MGATVAEQGRVRALGADEFVNYSMEIGSFFHMRMAAKWPCSTWFRMVD